MAVEVTSARLLEGRARTTLPAVRLALDVLLVVILGIAGVMKMLTPSETALLMAHQVRNLAGIALQGGVALASVLALEAVLVGALVLRRKLAAGVILAAGGLGFLLMHAGSLSAGLGEHCGCFGADAAVPRIVPMVTAGLLLASGAWRLMGLVPSARSVRASVLIAALWLGLPAAFGTVAGHELQTILEDAANGRDPDTIAARDRLLFVFSPKCPECLVAARNLRTIAETGRLVGVTTRSLGATPDFFSALGFRFPVELIAPAAWFRLIDHAPPAFWYVDGDGTLSRRTAASAGDPP